MATLLNGLADKINEMARLHGFWEAERNFGEMLMLATSELAEALEEHRDGKPDVYYKCKTCGFETESPAQAFHFIPRTGLSWRILELFDGRKGRVCDGKEGGLKPEGAAVELVDCLIRVLDTLHSRNVDIDRVVEIKMQYNDSRPYKHGKAY